MRLHELSTPSSLTVTPDQARATLNSKSGMAKFTKIMRQAGFRRLGEGAYASVFAHPSYDYVFKVYASHGGYRSFLDYCYRNSSNPNLPRFRGKSIRIDPEWACIRMERLSKIKQSNELADYLECCRDAARYYVQHNKKQPFEKTKFYDILSNCLKRMNQTPAPLFSFGFDATFFETLVDLFKMAASASPRLYDDLHMGNIMKRGATIVITDPFAD